jgi:hypothetical protein
MVTGPVRIQNRLLISDVNVEPRVDLVRATWLYLDSCNFFMAVIRVYKMDAKFLIMDSVRWTVFGQYCAIVPLISHRPLSVWRENCPLLGARSCIETHRKLGVGLCLI